MNRPDFTLNQGLYDVSSCPWKKLDMDSYWSFWRFVSEAQQYGGKFRNKILVIQLTGWHTWIGREP